MPVKLINTVEQLYREINGLTHPVPMASIRLATLIGYPCEQLREAIDRHNLLARFSPALRQQLGYAQRTA